MQVHQHILCLSCVALIGCAPAWVLPVRSDGNYRQSISVDAPSNITLNPGKDYFAHRTDLAKRRPDTFPIVRTRYMPDIPENLGPLESELEILVVVEADGVVRESVLTVSCGKREIDELYLAAIHNWTFTPALIDRRPVAMEAKQVFRIKLH